MGDSDFYYILYRKCRGKIPDNTKNSVKNIYTCTYIYGINIYKVNEIRDPTILHY